MLRLITNTETKAAEVAANVETKDVAANVENKNTVVLVAAVAQREG